MDNINFLIPFISQYGYLIIFASAFLESLILFGFLLPGSLIILFGGFVARNGTLSLPLVLLLAFLGMFIGDIANYFLGKTSWKKIFLRTKLSKYFQQKEKIALSYFEKFGISIIYYSHIVGYLRSIICFTAGIINISLKRFLLATFLSSILWSLIYVLLGYFLAQTNYELGKLNNRIQIISLIIVALIIIFTFIKIKLKTYMENRLKKRNSEN